MKYFILIILYVLAFNEVEFALDTTKQVQYRRGIELQPGYQSYEEKYFGKNLLDEKRSKLPLQSTGVWTELNPKVPRVDYIGIHFVNKDTGWACGDLGAIIKTTDGGQNWTVSATNTTALILKIFSLDDQLVIATGYDGIILRSSDGGENFAQVVSGVGSGIDLWGVQMVNDTLGWVCGLNQTLLKTTDAGLTWLSVNAGLNAHYWSLDFLNENYGMIACGGGKVLKTTDGGNSWTQTQAGDTRDLYTIDVIDSLHIAAAGGSFGKNVYSNDGGTSWTENTNLPYSQGANWIYFMNKDTGYVTGNSLYLRKTTNRGQSWFSTPYFEIGRWQFEILNGNTGYGVGDNLTITKTEDDFTTGSQLILNVSFADVFFINEMKGFAIGGALYKTEDGGINWEKMTGAPGGSDILFLDSLAGFIGASGSIFKTTVGGESWYATQGSTGAERIFFINETTGWAIRNNEIYKTTDRGENWFTQLTLPTDNFTSIFFVDSLIGWATSRYVWQTTNEGENWVERTDIPIFLPDDIYFPNLDTGWVSRYSSINNSLFRTTDGGLNWTAYPEVIGARKFYFFPDPVHWLTLGFSRYYISNDYGTNWLEFTEDVPTGLVSFSAPSNNLGYVVGSKGLILRYEDTTYVPVELISFNTEVDNNIITLKWSTATETNNLGFEIERNTPHNPLSRGEAEGRGVWRSIGFVNGNGTTTEPQSYSFLDKELSVGKYQYRLKQIDSDGTFEYSNTIEVEIGNPTKFSLEQNYPNPFNPSTTIRYQIPQDGIVTLKIYNILGSEVATLVNEEKVAGKYEVNFNASSLASGVYIYKIHSGSFINSKKMILIK